MGAFDVLSLYITYPPFTAGRLGVLFPSLAYTVSDRLYSPSAILGILSKASYDYGSAIAENRELTTKYAELKRQGLFLRSSPEFYKTDRIGDSTTGAVVTTDPSVYATLLRNPDTNASFYIARQDDSTSA